MKKSFLTYSQTGWNKKKGPKNDSNNFECDKLWWMILISCICLGITNWQWRVWWYPALGDPMRVIFSCIVLIYCSKDSLIPSVSKLLYIIITIIIVMNEEASPHVLKQTENYKYREDHDHPLFVMALLRDNEYKLFECLHFFK